MENLRTIQEYIEAYQKNAGTDLSISAMKAYLDRNWSDWCLPDTAFKIDTLVQAQKQLDKMRADPSFDPYELLESRNVTPLAENILEHICDIWTCLGRTKYGYGTWSAYIRNLQKHNPNVYQNFINIIVNYIQLRIRELYS